VLSLRSSPSWPDGSFPVTSPASEMFGWRQREAPVDKTDGPQRRSTSVTTSVRPLGADSHAKTSDRVDDNPAGKDFVGRIALGNNNPQARGILWSAESGRRSTVLWAHPLASMPTWCLLERVHARILSAWRAQPPVG
jgi:hypothetical protein